MRKCYLKVFDDGGVLEVALFNRKKKEIEGLGIDVESFPSVLASEFPREGVYELRSYDKGSELRASFPVHPDRHSSRWPAYYGGISRSQDLVYICLPFLTTLLGKVRLKGLLENDESHIAYVTVKRISS